jgi:hypothetical protein
MSCIMSMKLAQRLATSLGFGSRSAVSMKKITVLIELDVKKLSDIDALQDMIEEALAEALDQDEEVSIKVTAEFAKGRHQQHS